MIRVSGVMLLVGLLGILFLTREQCASAKEAETTMTVSPTSQPAQGALQSAPPEKENTLEVVKFVLAVVGGLLALLGFAVKLRTDYQKTLGDHAKWVTQLYEKFYSESKLKTVREALDEDTDYGKVCRMVDPYTGGNRLGTAFTHYLNFFEYVAYLWKRGRLTMEEVDGLFGYDLWRLRRVRPVFNYINTPAFGFRKLREMLPKMPKREGCDDGFEPDPCPPRDAVGRLIGPDDRALLNSSGNLALSPAGGNMRATPAECPAGRASRTPPRSGGSWKRAVFAITLYSAAVGALAAVLTFSARAGAGRLRNRR